MSTQPDAGGHFGTYGGRYVPEVLMSPLEALEQAFKTLEQRRRRPFFIRLFYSAPSLSDS